MTAPLIIAHRTCPLDAPENSLSGLRKAAELGADGVEIDLRMSLDLLPFLMHDWTMRRTTSWPLPTELTPAAIVRRQLLQGREERVPSLEQALDALPDSQLLAVDVKTPWAIAALVRAIKRRRIEARVLIWCTSALDVRYAVARAPGAEVAYLKTALGREPGLSFIAKARRLGAQAVSAHWQAIDEEFVREAHALGLRVYSYHAAAALTPEKLSAGLDGLITDYPAQAREALAQIKIG